MEPSPQKTQTPNSSQQPEWQPQVAPTEAQKPQYVITQQSLRGVGGWLLFWVIIFALMGIGSITKFFTAVSSSPTNFVDLIMSPIAAIVTIAAVVYIIMQKKLGRPLAIAALIITTLQSIIEQLMKPQENYTATISTIVVAIVITGLFSLYFVQSRRVKETLIN